MSAPPRHVSDGFEWWAPLAAFLVAFGAGVIAFAILAAAIGEQDAPGVTLGATLVQNAALIVAMVVLAGMGGVRVTPATFGLRRVDPRRVIGVAAAMFLLFYVFLVAWSQLDRGAEDDLLEDLGAKDSTVALVATALLTVLVAPIAEELFFRGFLFGALRRALDWRLAAVIAGVAFGAVHLGTPPIFLVPLAVFGGLLCVLYQRTGSLIPGMAVHALNNALAFGVGLEWLWWQVLLMMAGGVMVVSLLAAAVAE